MAQQLLFLREIYKLKLQTAELDTTKQVNSLDSNYADAQAIAKLWTANSLAQMPQLSFNQAELNLLGSKFNQYFKLANYLTTKYGQDFNDIGWHGRLSQQRIFFQDERVIKELSDPLFVKAILFVAQNNYEQDLGKGNTIASLILYGLSSNRLSFLATAAPNWCIKADIPGISWEAVSKGQMSKCVTAKETPWVITPQYIESLHTALATVQQVLVNTNGNKVIPQPSSMQQEIFTKINELNSAQLLKVIENICTDYSPTKILTAGAAGISTYPENMNIQCLEVISEYKNLLNYHQGDNAAVLGYGLVSHALDPRHLAAAIYYLNKDGVKNHAQQNLADILSELKSNTCDKKTEMLLRARLQQLVILVYEKRNSLGLSEDKLLEKLSRASYPRFC